MKISTFWVVTLPTLLSTPEDIVFESNPKEISKQFFGGLNPDDIVGFYTDKESALKIGKKLLKKCKRNA